MDNRKRRRRRSWDCLNLPAFNPCLPQNPKGQWGTNSIGGNIGVDVGMLLSLMVFSGYIYIYINERRPLIGSRLGLSFRQGPNLQLERLTCIHKQVDVWWPESKATMTWKCVEKHTLSFCCGHTGSSFSSMGYTCPTCLNHGEQGTDAVQKDCRPDEVIIHG